MKKPNLAILLYSCKKNSDMWNIFLQLFKKYWSDCEYPVILLTDFYDEHSDTRFDEVITLDSSWRDMVEAGIKKAGTKYVMLFMDDYLLCDYVDNAKIKFFLEEAEKYNAANIRLLESPTIKAVSFDKNSSYHYYEPGTAYSFSTQVGIWNAECLLKYCKKGWSAWDFERKGSVEIRDYKHPLLAPKDYAFPYEEGVRKGKWMDVGVRICKRNNIKLDFSKRKAMSNFELAWIYFKGGILQLNPTIIVKIQNKIQRKKR